MEQEFVRKRQGNTPSGSSLESQVGSVTVFPKNSGFTVRLSGQLSKATSTVSYTTEALAQVSAEAVVEAEAERLVEAEEVVVVLELRPASADSIWIGLFDTPVRVLGFGIESR